MSEYNSLKLLLKERQKDNPKDWLTNPGRTNPQGWTYFHSLRLFNMIDLLETPEEEKRLLKYAALLHDICKYDKENHAYYGSEEIIQSCLVPPGIIIPVSLIVKNHLAVNSYSWRDNSYLQLCYEFSDLDHLDQNFGLTSVYRSAKVCSKRKMSLEDVIARFRPPSTEESFLNGRKKHFDNLRTMLGKSLAEIRYSRMEAFVEQVVSDYDVGDDGFSSLGLFKSLMQNDITLNIEEDFNRLDSLVSVCKNPDFLNLYSIFKKELYGEII